MSESDAGHYPIGKTLRLGTKIAGFITVENHGDRQQQPFELGAGTIVDVQSVRLKSSEHHHLPGAQEPSASDYEYLVHSDIYTVIGNIYAPEGKALDGVRGRTRTYPICHTQLAPVGRKKGELAPDGVCRHPLRPGEFAKVINEDTDDYTGTKVGDMVATSSDPITILSGSPLNCGHDGTPLTRHEMERMHYRISKAKVIGPKLKKHSWISHTYIGAEYLESVVAY